MLYNGFGEHNIQGIGDKHIPLIHNVYNTDIVTAVTDRATDHLVCALLLSGRAGRTSRGGAGRCRPRRWTRSRLVRPLEHLQRPRRREDRQVPRPRSRRRPDDGRDRRRRDVRERAAAHRRARLSRRLRRALAAAEAFGRCMLGAETDHLLETTHEDRERIFNLGYFTWVEQQGVPIDEFDARREQSFWTGLRAELPRWDELIRRVQRAAPGSPGERVVTTAPLREHDISLRRAAAPRRAGRRPLSLPCPNSADGDVDHVLGVLGDRPVRFPRARWQTTRAPIRRATAIFSTATTVRPRGGITDEQFVELVRRARRGGRPGRRSRLRGDALRAQRASCRRALGFVESGGIWVKDETGNVAGLAQGAPPDGRAPAPRGGRAARPRRSRERHPTSRSPAAATPRSPPRSSRPRRQAAAGLRAGRRRRPHHRAARRARGGRRGLRAEPAGELATRPISPARGARRGRRRFTCQGNLNGLAIEGGETLGFEMISELASDGVELDHLVVQVGGGALASSCMQAFSEALALGALAGSTADPHRADGRGPPARTCVPQGAR